MADAAVQRTPLEGSVSVSLMSAAGRKFGGEDIALGDISVGDGGTALGGISRRAEYTRS